MENSSDNHNEDFFRFVMIHVQVNMLRKYLCSFLDNCSIFLKKKKLIIIT